MAQITWSDTATNDFHEIIDYIRADSPGAAARVAHSIITAVERLIEYPEIGRMLPELRNPAVREVLSAPYRIVYWYRRDVCEIISVIHGSRDILRHFPSGPWNLG